MMFNSRGESNHVEVIMYNANLILNKYQLTLFEKKRKEITDIGF